MKKPNKLNSLRLQLDQSIVEGIEYLYKERHDDGSWQSAMIGGPVHASLALTAKAVWNEFSAQDEDLLQCLLDGQKTDGSFLSYLGGPAVIGVQELVTACLEVLATQQMPVLIRERLQKALIRTRQFSDASVGGRMYCFLARLLRQAMATKPPSFLGFPWYLMLFDLIVHHWIFSWLRRSVSASIMGQLPAIGLLLEAAARRTLLVRSWRATFGRMGSSRRNTRINSLRKALVVRQEPNGCWSWTVLGTAVNLLALQVFNENREKDPVVRRGLAYLDHHRRQLPDGKLYQAWTGSSVWDTALAAEVLLLGDVLEVEEALKIGRELVAHQVSNGLTGFDNGITYGDNDSTAVVLSYLSKTSSLHNVREQPWLTHAIEKCVKGLITSQLSDGGWGFAPSHPIISFGARPPGEQNAIWNDASSPDLTARVVLGLMAARQTGHLDMAILDSLDKTVLRAIRYFEASQHQDGYWWSRWSGRPIVATSLVLLASSAADVSTKSPWIARGRSWLLRNAEKTSVEKAWSLAGLVASSPEISIANDEEILRVATVLASNQKQGTWESRAAYPFSYRVDLFIAPLFDHISICSMMIFTNRALLKGIRKAQREILWGRRQIKARNLRSHESTELTKRYEEIIKVARKLAGSGDDIGQRIVTHYWVYRDSGRNFTFPILALHGAGWAYGYFRFLNFLLPFYVTLRFPISWRKRAEFKKSMIRAMAGFKAANQRVLVDTYANYHFTKQFGRVPGAVKILSEPLLSMLNEMHEATSEGEPMTNSLKSKIYSQSFQWEQSNSVWPMVERTIREINDPIVKAIAFRPIVQFSFFPWWEFLIFSDFTKTEERIEEGWKAYHIAERVGWSTTERAIGKYKMLPLDLLEYYERLLKRSEVYENR